MAWDNDGYDIPLNHGGGRNIHSFHPKFDITEIPLPPRFFSESQKKDLRILHDTRCGECTCSAYLLSMTGRCVPCSKIVFMMDELTDGDKEFETFGGDIDKMLRLFETDKQTSYSVLLLTFDASSPTEILVPMNLLEHDWSVNRSAQIEEV